MKLYLSHASNFDYQTELYEPLKASLPAEFEVFYPHDPENDGKYSKDILESSDVVIAEVSRPSTGQGIELGWASAANVKVLCFYKAGSRPSSAVKYIAAEIVEYARPEDIATLLVDTLK